MPACNCRARLVESATRLPGNARTTIWSPGDNSPSSPRVVWRKRRATRWRCTAPPTDFATTKPTSGADATSARQAWTTMSGCAARTPRLTVWLKSADRVIRFWAGSTGSGSRFRRSGNDGPCDAGPTRWPARHESSSAAENHGPSPGAGYSAGRCACPWPRQSLLVSGSHGHLDDLRASPVAGLPLLNLVEPARSRTARSLPCRRRLGDCSRVLRSLAQVKPHSSRQQPTRVTGC